MALVSLDYMEKRTRIVWSSETKIFLCCMIKYFEEDRSAFEAIFNSQFARELGKCGFTNGMIARWPRLKSRWVSLRNDGDPIWGDVHTSGFSPEPWLPFIDMIEETAASLKISVTRKPQDTADCSQFVYQNPVSRSRSGTGQLSQDEPLQGDGPRQELISTPAQERLDELDSSDPESSLCTAGGKICFWCHAENLDQKAADGLDTAQTPPLLYRWWNVESQGVNSKTKFVAGLFSDITQSYFSPGTITEDQFYRFYESHIRRVKTPSPFISTFKSARAPIHRALRNGEGASISIIDTKRLKVKIYSAAEFVQTRKVKVKNSNYNGAGEYLVWGHIDSDAVICTFKVTTLRKITEEHHDINRLLQLDTISESKWNRWYLHRKMEENAIRLDIKAGAVVGKLLSFLEVPQEYCRIVSEGIAYSWKVKTKHIPWRGFFEGVELGYRGELVMVSPGLSPVSDAHGPDGHIASDSDVYSFCEDSLDDDDDDEDIEDDIEANDNASAVDARHLNEAGPDDTPTPPEVRPGSERSVSIVGFEETLATQRINASFMIDMTDSSDERLDDADEELDLFDGVILDRERMTSDLFASDRARVRSAFE